MEWQEKITKKFYSINQKDVETEKNIGKDEMSMWSLIVYTKKIAGRSSGHVSRPEYLKVLTSTKNMSGEPPPDDANKVGSSEKCITYK
jgi:hypothetical protein